MPDAPRGGGEFAFTSKFFTATQQQQLTHLSLIEQKPPPTGERR